MSRPPFRQAKNDGCCCYAQSLCRIVNRSSSTRRTCPSSSSPHLFLVESTLISTSPFFFINQDVFEPPLQIQKAYSWLSFNFFCRHHWQPFFILYPTFLREPPPPHLPFHPSSMYLFLYDFWTHHNNKSKKQYSNRTFSIYFCHSLPTRKMF